MMGNDVIYNDLMQKGQICKKYSEMVGNSQWREEQISLFYELKEKLQFVTRDVLYLAIAIYDKYLLQEIHRGHGFANFHEKDLRVHACLLIAHKFLNKNSKPLEKMLKLLELNQSCKCDIILIEAEILQRIDFVIPYVQTYTSLRSAHEQLNHDGKFKTIAIRCLSFLKEAVLFSSQFSLNPDLGPLILETIVSERTEDARIRQVYFYIKRKREIKRENIALQQKCLFIMAE